MTDFSAPPIVPPNPQMPQRAVDVELESILGDLGLNLNTATSTNFGVPEVEQKIIINERVSKDLEEMLAGLGISSTSSSTGSSSTVNSIHTGSPNLQQPKSFAMGQSTPPSPSTFEVRSPPPALIRTPSAGAMLQPAATDPIVGGGPGPVCAQCNTIIVGRWITALGKKWHPEHFVCAQCFNPFPNGTFFEYEGKPYCETDYHELFGPRCGGCGRAIIGRCVTALNKKWHPEHFVCTHCGKSLAGGSFVERNGFPYCKGCKKPEDPVPAPSTNDVCGRCKKPIVGEYVIISGQKMHPEHFTCAECHTPFKGSNCYEFEGKLFCDTCYKQLLASCCASCHKPITGRCVTALGRQWHPEHFVCFYCKNPFQGGSFFEKDGRPYCETHYHQLFATLCAKCGKSIAGRGVTALDKQWHPEHFTCACCDKNLAGATFCEWDGKPMCKKCYLKLPSDLRKRLGKNKKK